MSSQHINLFQTKTTLRPVLAMIERYVKTVSLVLLSIVFSGGIMVGIAFFVFGNQRDSMEVKKQEVMTQIKKEEGKESLFLMIRNQLGVINAILPTQVSYAPFLDTTMRIIQSFPLSSFSLGAKNSIIISVNVGSTQEAMTVLSTVLDMEQKKQIVNPILQSFTLEHEKKIQLGLSYTVVL